MPKTRFDELKRYVRFSEADAARLAAFLPFAQPHFVRIAREFYERIREHEEAHAVFTGEAQIERLHRSMIRWMERLLSGIYDESYHAETQKIGRVHVRVGLPQRYMFTAMALIRNAFAAVADRELGAEAISTRHALDRLIDLDLAIMVESYREDLTDQVRKRDELAAKALKSDLDRALRLYETATDVTPTLLVGVDVGGAIRLFNREAQKVTGFSVEDVYGTPFVDHVRTESTSIVAELLAGGPTERSVEMPIQTRAGKLRDVEWRLSRVAGDQEIVLFAVGMDVTDARAVARQLQRNEKLAALGTLAAGLAHEIRNPLNGAQLHVAFLRRALEKAHGDADMLEAAGFVADEIQRLAQLVTEFLDFARPSSLSLKETSLSDVVLRVRELTAGAAAAAGVDVQYDAPLADVVAVFDAGKIQQVLLNLVQNAIEALAPAHSGTVVIRARRQPRTVAIEVEDDGPGLPSPDAPVFDAFFSTKPAGTGLGLAITHRIVTDHGGTMDVDSRPGRTCFRFTLPLGQEEDA